MAKAGKLDKSSEPLSVDMLHKMNAYFSAANYLSVGQIYLFNNPLLREPLKPDDIKPRLLGHWGTTPGLNFVYVHMNRVIKKYDLDMIFVTGPGHGGPALVANTYLEGTYSEFYPNVSEDEEGMKKLLPSFLSRAVFQAILPPKRRARSMKVASWDIPCRTLSARLSTIPI